MKAKFLLTFGLALLFMQSIDARDYLNVVKVDESVRSFRLDDIDKITFDAENIYIEKVNASSEHFSFDDIEILTFLNSFVTLVELPVLNKSEIDVFYNVMLDNVMVKSVIPIKHIAVYNMLGRVVKQIKPNTLQIEISMQNTPYGLYLISAATAEGKVSKKIVKQ
jgi:hypothetical protein